MPYAIDNPPDILANVPTKGQEIWIKVFNSAYNSYEGSADKKEQIAHATAWHALGEKYEEDASGKWHLKSAMSTKRSWVEGSWVIVEVNKGLDGYHTLVFKPYDENEGVWQNEGDGLEPAALYFRVDAGWTQLTAKLYITQHTDEKLKSVDDEYKTIRQAKFVDSVTDASQQITFSEVLVPWEVDAQGQFATDEDVERACYKFMERYQQLKGYIGLQHDDWGTIIDPNHGTVVENFIAREGDANFEPGAWVMAVRWKNEAWQEILNGKVTGLSIGGSWDVVPIVE